MLGEIWSGTEAARRASVARTAGTVAPGLAHYTDEVLFAEIWRRPGLAPRDRSLVTVAALITNGQAEQLPFHLGRAMDNGLTATEAGGVVTHLAFYTGWPRAFSALGPLKAVLEDRSATPAPDHLVVTPLEAADATKGPADRFVGDVRVESRFSAFAPGRARGAMVRFDPGARTAWHTHPLGQVLVITEGEGWVQSDGQPRQTVRPGDVVRIPPNVRHWHGGTVETSMAHVAIVEALDGQTTSWMEQVPDAVYLEGQP